MTVYWSDGSGGPQQWAGRYRRFTVDADGNFSGLRRRSAGAQDTHHPSICVGGNFDPVITMGVGFVDSGAPSIFTFGVSSPLAPTITGTASYKLDLSGSFADGASDGGSMGSGFATFGIMDGQVNLTSFAGIGSPIGSFPAGGSHAVRLPFRDRHRELWRRLHQLRSPALRQWVPATTTP